MGLDSIWVTEGGTDVFNLDFTPPLQLCGGLFSGHGTGSFRGKVYSYLIEDITGESLYQERIPNATVRMMAEKLSDLPTAYAVHRYQVSVREYEDLRRMFAAYAQAGADLVGWW